VRSTRAEWVGPYDDLRLGLGDVAKLYYYPGWWEPGPSMNFLVTVSAWDKLPGEYQAIIEAATTQASAAMTQRYDRRNPDALATLREKGVEVVPFPDDVLASCRRASEQLLDDSAARDADYRRILENWRAFRRGSDAWLGTSELRYAQAVWGA
jgi:TRAP-type mannitol/chloroaromatic compound transport system substrate-binding protein